MDKITAGLLGAVAGLATIGTAQASIAPATAPAAQPASYADLLQPIPNAVELLKADNATRTQDALASGSFQLADYYDREDYAPRYHHHHHHHNYGERYGYDRRNEHHHHHHHNNTWVGVPGVGGVVVHHGD